MKLRHVMTTTSALVAATAALALAAGPSPSISGGLVGSGTLIVPSTTVHLSRSSGFVMENAKVPRGATFGWHSHRTAVVVAITAGTLTLYDSSGRTCSPHRYNAGQGFIEPANHLHMARNEGNTSVTLYATYIGVPASLRANPNNLDVLGLDRPHKCPPRVQ